MKTLILTIFILLITLSAYPQDSLLVKANQQYADGKYEQAIDLYQQILKSNMESAEVYYNLGNAWYKTGQFTKAIINYERAKLLAPNDEDIQFNLEIANQHVVDAIEPLPKVFFIRWWHNLVNKFPADGWAKINVVTFIVVLILAGFFFFSALPGIKRVSFWAGVIILAISIFSYSFAARQEKRMTEHRFAIITQPSVTVKSSPSEGGTNLFLIHEGLKVEILDNLGTWNNIRLADGNQGWLPDNSMEKI
jgi:tetratricopeptide (TPR) repeat protein